MAASTQPVDGGAYVVQISTDSGTTWKTLGFQTDGSVNRSTESKERSSKQTCQWMSNRPGRRSWDVSGSGLFSNGQGTEMNFHELHTLWESNTSFDVKMTAIDCDTGSPIVDEYEYTGQGFFTDLPQQHQDNEDSTYNFTIQGTDALTQAVITV